MMNLTPMFQQSAEQSATGWSLDAAGRVLEQLRDCLDNSIIDWEKGDEEWGRIIQNQQVVALVCARLPFVIVLAKMKQAVEKALLGSSLSLVSVEDMSAKLFSVDKHILEFLFSKQLSDNIDYEHASIDDLWWATV
jgi:hypothetical protein